MVNIQTRVVNILTKPKEEWSVIAAETTDATTLTTSYIAILAAIPPAAAFIGLSIIGIGTFLGTTYRIGIVRGISSAIVQYVLSIAGVHLAAFVVDKLAPNFKSQASAIQSLKLVTYASTATWVAGVLNLLPPLSPLAFLAGLRALYLFYTGATPL